jgi:hypothetical protein
MKFSYRPIVPFAGEFNAHASDERRLVLKTKSRQMEAEMLGIATDYWLPDFFV